MNGDYHTDQDLNALYTVFDTVAATEYDDLLSLKRHYENRATDYRKRGAEWEAQEFDKKAAAVGDELAKRGYTEGG